jgi:hypothetical protein
LEKQNENKYWILKFISENNIGDVGAAKLGEGVSKLLNLSSLNLNFE